MIMSCPCCNSEMEGVTLASHMGTHVEIDVCWPCRVIWFDNLESASLSPGSVIELFKRIHMARDSNRNLLKNMTDCPICATTLKVTSDLGKSGRFSYARCENCHGRLISFVQFLREKSFIRSLQPHEISALLVTVKQIRCSSCGGPINLESDRACTHCGAAISVLDEVAVEKALAELQAKEIQRQTLDPTRLGDVIMVIEANARHNHALQSLQQKPNNQNERLGNISASNGLADLVETGIGAALAVWLRK